ncbi:MAG: DNA-protecting protein DprA [Chromatiales bacterium]|jgi:DNA processing protein|nr:DNA-protecting protein DprA [Chromatiales bacterium]
MPAAPPADPRTATWLADPANTVIDPGDPAYPPQLQVAEPRPPRLYVRGDAGCLVLPQLAIVGSRNATPGGRDTARSFAAYLAARGFVITSGLAEGIDAAAHAGALEAGGRTIAVCGTGLDRVYPRTNAALAGRIVAGGGALAGELPPGTGAQRHHFPRRNRIISGLAVGTLVVEASTTSGALITARHAAEQGREVFAIPGSIHNPLTRGCHQLIRSGATLVETAADIVEQLGSALAGLAAGVVQLPADAPAAAPGAAIDDDPAYRRLLEALGHDPVDVDALVQRSGLTTGEVSSMLLMLELQGRVHSLAGSRYQRSRRQP